MGRREHVEISTPHHCLLYENRRGQPIRMMARVGLAISATVLMCLGWAYWNSNTGETGHSLSTATTVGFLIAGVGAALFARSSWHLGKHFVLHFEVWPRSHLAIVRTAGIWREQVHMVPWRDLRTLEAPHLHEIQASDPWVRIRLCSGRRLIFDHYHGSAPQSWAALGRFLQKRSLPDSSATEFAVRAA